MPLCTLWQGERPLAFLSSPVRIPHCAKPPLVQLERERERESTIEPLAKVRLLFRSNHARFFVCALSLFVSCSHTRKRPRAVHFAFHRKAPHSPNFRNTQRAWLVRSLFLVSVRASQSPLPGQSSFCAHSCSLTAADAKCPLVCVLVFGTVRPEKKFEKSCLSFSFLP